MTNTNSNTDKEYVFTGAEVNELMDALENIDLQMDAIQNAEHLLTDYLEIFTGAEQKELWKLGYDAKDQFYKLQIIDDYLLRAIESINNSLEIIPTAYDLFKAMKESKNKPNRIPVTEMEEEHDSPVKPRTFTVKQESHPVREPIKVTIKQESHPVREEQTFTITQEKLEPKTIIIPVLTKEEQNEETEENEKA